MMTQRMLSGFVLALAVCSWSPAVAQQQENDDVLPAPREVRLSEADRSEPAQPQGTWETLLRALFSPLQRSEARSSAEEPQPPTGETARDPFSVSPAMRQLAAQSSAPGPAGQRRALPELRVKGIASSSARPAAALLEIADERMIVRQGEVLNLSIEGSLFEVRIEQIGNGFVLINTDGQQQLIPVR